MPAHSGSSAWGNSAANNPGIRLGLALTARLSFIPPKTGQRPAAEGNKVMTDATITPADVAPPPGPIAGLAILGIVLLLIVAWIVLGTQALHLADTSLVGGFMMLWYWANNEQLEISRLPAAIIGAVVGIGLAWFLVFGAVQYGGSGLTAALLLLVLALYLDIIKALPLIVNTSTMLYVTLAAAPLVQLHVNWTELVISTVIGGLFFGGVVEGLKRLAARSAGAG